PPPPTRAPPPPGAGRSSPPLDLPPVHHPSPPRPPVSRPPYDVIRVEVRHGETGVVGNDLDLVAHREATIEGRRRGDPDHAVLLRQRGHGQVRLASHRAHGLRPHVRGPRVLRELQRPRIHDEV